MQIEEITIQNIKTVVVQIEIFSIEDFKSNSKSGVVQMESLNKFQLKILNLDLHIKMASNQKSCSAKCFFQIHMRQNSWCTISFSQESHRALVKMLAGFLA